MSNVKCTETHSVGGKALIHQPFLGKLKVTNLSVSRLFLDELGCAEHQRFIEVWSKSSVNKIPAHLDIFGFTKW